MLTTSFNILDYVDKLQIKQTHTTWLEAVCPVCGGKLKISTVGIKRGAYACYTSECHKLNPNPIRNHLDPGSRFKIVPRTKTMKIIPKLLPFDRTEINYNYSLDQFYIQNKDYNPDQFVDNARIGNNIITRFYYLSEDDEVYEDVLSLILVRVDNVVTHKKSIYFQYTYDQVAGVPICTEGTPKKPISKPFFRKEVIQPFCIFVEGEKCAYIAQKHDLAAFSIPAYMHSEYYLPDVCQTLKNMGVTDILIFRDNDHPGLLKASLLGYNLYRKGIRAKIVNIAEYAHTTDIGGYDIADYYQDNAYSYSTHKLLEWAINV